MRILFSLGIQKRPANPVELRASADGAEGNGTRWFTGHLDLRTLIAICSFATVLITMRVTTASRQSALETQVRADHESIASLNHRLGEEYVTRETYDKGIGGVYVMLGSLDRGQQQIYGLMVQGSALQPRYVLPKVVPYHE
jgi:hypothetical protein